MIDILASEPHFADHLVPIYNALPENMRGRVIAKGSPVLRRFESLGLPGAGGIIHGDDPILVASFGDLRRAKDHDRVHVVIMEHGAGQSYGGTTSSDGHGSYAGGKYRYADLFLHPGPHPAARDQAAYPQARVEVVGSPYLDLLPAHVSGETPVVAVTTHFDSVIAPEATSAFSSFQKQIAQLARGYKVIGSAHPMMLDRLRPWYEKRGIEVVEDFREISERADLLVADNTSVMFAFAATGRPVVVLNPPHYRRSITHGLRFWEAAHVGVNVTIKDDLVAAVARGLERYPEDEEAREDALSKVYAYRTGAAARAASVLVDWTRSIAQEVAA